MDGMGWCPIESAPKFFLCLWIDCGRWFLPTLVLSAVIPEPSIRSADCLTTKGGEWYSYKKTRGSYAHHVVMQEVLMQLWFMIIDVNLSSNSLYNSEWLMMCMLYKKQTAWYRKLTNLPPYIIPTILHYVLLCVHLGSWKDPNLCQASCFDDTTRPMGQTPVEAGTSFILCRKKSCNAIAVSTKKTHHCYWSNICILNSVQNEITRKLYW